MNKTMNRRNFICNSMMAAGLSSISQHAVFAGSEAPDLVHRLRSSAEKKFSISIFSKNLHWLDFEEMAATAAELGFDGIELTVRPEGHVLPERVAEDLPRANDAVRKAGLNIYGIVTAIDNPDDPRTEKIIQTCSKLGITNYRLGWFRYEEGVSMQQNLSRITEKMRRFEALNSEYQVHGGYQNHSGKYFGAPVWDLAAVLKNINAKWTGSQYDVYHATIEGANSWSYGLEMLIPYIKTITIKDFEWKKDNEKSVHESVPLGKGMVDFDQYFKMLQKFDIHCPISVHYEYPLGGADQGNRTLTVPKQDVLTAMRQDLTFLKARLKAAGF
jgi:L-ribulose-5-phosphate 3-epimerase